MGTTEKHSKVANAQGARGSNSIGNGSHEPEEENDLGSHGAESMDLLSMTEKMVQSSHKRRDNRRRKLRMDYINAMNVLENDLTITFDEEHKRISQAYKIRAHNLAAVLKRRTRIENDILASIERLNTAYTQAANELRLTVAGRVRVAAKRRNSADIGGQWGHSWLDNYDKISFKTIFKNQYIYTYRPPTTE